MQCTQIAFDAFHIRMQSECMRSDCIRCIVHMWMHSECMHSNNCIQVHCTSECIVNAMHSDCIRCIPHPNVFWMHGTQIAFDALLIRMHCECNALRLHSMHCTSECILNAWHSDCIRCIVHPNAFWMHALRLHSVHCTSECIPNACTQIAFGALYIWMHSECMHSNCIQVHCTYVNAL